MDTGLNSVYEDFLFVPIMTQVFPGSFLFHLWILLTCLIISKIDFKILFHAAVLLEAEPEIRIEVQDVYLCSWDSRGCLLEVWQLRCCLPRVSYLSAWDWILFSLLVSISCKCAPWEAADAGSGCWIPATCAREQGLDWGPSSCLQPVPTLAAAAVLGVNQHMGEILVLPNK